MLLAKNYCFPSSSGCKQCEDCHFTESGKLLTTGTDLEALQYWLQVANTANTDTCSSSVVVLDTPPTITCAATIKVAATANCRAQPTQSDLAASIVTASTQGSGGPLDFTITPSIAG